MPYVRPSRDGPPKLKLILAPRQVIDLNYLIKEGVEIVQHNAISPEVCHTIVKDLNSPTGKGAELFAKRKKKSEEWIVDDEKVKYSQYFTIFFRCLLELHQYKNKGYIRFL